MSGTTLPNLHYTMYRAKHAKLGRQVDEFPTKDFIRKITSPCVLMTLMTKKDEGGGCA